MRTRGALYTDLFELRLNCEYVSRIFRNNMCIPCVIIDFFMFMINYGININKFEANKLEREEKNRF